MNRAIPSPVPRPAFAFWLWDRDIPLREAAVELECSYEQVRIICLPFSDKGRRVPSEALLERIVEWTGGQITAVDFYPPRLTGGRTPRDDQAVSA